MSNRICLLISFVFVLGLVAGASAQPTYLGRTSWWSDLDSNDHDWSRPDNWWTMDRYQDDVNQVIVYVKVGPNEVPDGNTSALIGKADGHAPYPEFLHFNPPENDPCITSGTFTPPSISCSGGYHLDPFISGSAPDHSDTNVLDPCYAHYLTMSGGTVTVGTPQTWEGYDFDAGWGDWWGRWGGGNVYIGTVGWRASLLGGLGAGLPSGTLTMTGGTLNVGGHMEVGSWEEAHGTLDMTGGTINITQGLYAPASWWGAGVLTGQVNLHGGTINARYFTMIQDPYTGNTGNLDIEAGKMVLGRNEEDKVQGYANGDVAQMSITVYGIAHGQITGGGQRAALNIDYDVSADGKTTVFASVTDPCQAWAPSPPDGAQNVKGPPANLQRPILSWSAGDNAASHQVYFGTSFAEVNDATTSSGAYKGPQGLADVNYTVGTDLDVFGTYHWRIDEVNAVAVKGVVWDFTIGNLGKASYPDPGDREDEVSPAVILGWTAGIYAATHDVYFGTSFSEVNDANTNSDAWMVEQAGTTWPTTGYDPNGLDYSTTYYWRIDEKDGGTYPGNVWSFITNSRLIVENFNSYVTTEPDLYAVWNDYYVNGSDATITLEKSPDIVHEGNSVAMNYYNITASGGKLIGSWMDASTSNLEIGSDWTLSGAAAIVLYFRGSAGNSVEKMWVELEDTSSNAGYVLYDGDANNIAVPSWHEWNIDLGIIDACGVTLSLLDNIKVGVGGVVRTGNKNKGTSSNVYFDDIEVWPARCRPAFASVADFTDDCIVDGYDLETMAEDWMMTDYNTLGYMGTLKGFPGASDPNYDNCWVAGKVDAGGLYFNLDDPDPNNPTDQGDDYVEIPPLNLNSNTISITLWAKRHGVQQDDGGLFFCSYRDDGPPDNTESGIMIGNAFIPENCVGYNWTNDLNTYKWNPGFGELPNDEWAFVALTMSPGRAWMYQMNQSTGVLQSNYNDVTHDPEEFDCPSRIGDHKTRRFVGAMDDFRIYDYTLDGNEIEYLAKGTGTPPDANHLYAHYKFNETTGLIAADDAGDMLNYWPIPSVANICGDGVEAEYHRFVNLIDFACFADHWLDVDLWP